MLLKNSCKLTLAEEISDLIVCDIIFSMNYFILSMQSSSFFTYQATASVECSANLVWKIIAFLFSWDMYVKGIFLGTTWQFFRFKSWIMSVLNPFMQQVLDFRMVLMKLEVCVVWRLDFFLGYILFSFFPVL